ncbi:DinB family protein [Jannaschia sp. S6380]|uniref:DinB family protein n=1 Tax=Jannaschia sp. S6380 TaxID=2926408 RepID=UPI001FF3403C|nr:DinB family protein [Jannaschia sp. S6380]MCK0166809.1 DinB family protein [Jannaschia sp. S6380]
MTGVVITPDFVRMMARYSAWQNAWHIEAIEGLDEAALTADRGAFFGSILGTANHLLWGDEIWLSRFAGTPPPEGGIPHSAALERDAAAWAARRRATDAGITNWAETLESCDGALTWHSGVVNADVSRPLDRLIVHFFNHQTHHRGQVHAMLTAAGVKTPLTDLAFMPDPQ